MRAAIATLSVNHFTDLLQGRIRIISLPDDATVIRVRDSKVGPSMESDGIDLLLQSSEFDEVNAGERFPPISIIAEATRNKRP